MVSIQPLSKDEIRIMCDDRTIDVQTGDKIVFKQDYFDFETGDTIIVEPIIDEGEVQLLCRKNSRHIRKDGIIEMFCDDIVNVEK